MTDVHYCSPVMSRAWLFYEQCPHCDNLCNTTTSTDDYFIDYFVDCTKCRCRQIDGGISRCVCLTAATDEEIAAHSCKYFIKRKEE